MNIELLVEKYLGTYPGVGAVYINPTPNDMRNMKSEGIREVRWIISKEAKKIYVWEAGMAIHSKVQNMLIDKGEIDSDAERLYTCQYDHPDWICGHGRLGVGKIEFTSKEQGDYGHREAEIGNEYSKYFYKASLK